MPRFRAVNGVLLIVACILSTHSNFAQTITPSDDWKNRITIPNDPFEVRSTASDGMGWTKFTILLDPYDPNLVYYQDSKKYSLHYTFATEWLDPFLGIAPEDFNAATLYQQGQQAILGAVITPPNEGYPPQPKFHEYGIQFVRFDPYTPEQTAHMFHLVRETIDTDPAMQALYFPSYEQRQVAESNREWFAQQDIIVSSPDRWLTNNVIYSSGWNTGLLRFVPSDQIASAYAQGSLNPTDILLTDAVPADLPILAGIITLSPSTPNSHVAILANTYSIPFVYLAEQEDTELAWDLVDQDIVFTAHSYYETTKIRLIQTEGVLTEQQIEELSTLKQPPTLNFTPIQSFGSYSAPVANLISDDICYFGGKATHYSILLHSIPDNCRIATAFSFDLWNDFLDQPIAVGTTLRQFIRSRLSGYTYPPANMAGLLHDLDDIRDMIRDADLVPFTPAIQQAVLDTLTDSRYGFEPVEKIRFRSSTNLEDTEYFTGAGLYDSYSGCLADELDDDDEGPSQCDPDENNERGVFRAIRRVFASFYNDNAYLERLRHNIDEDQVGMAILVHHSFPDTIELANGVATLDRTSTYSTRIKLVTQDGAVSVANPEPGVIPEEVEVYKYSSGTIYALLQTRSNLVPLGATVMDWKDDYLDLAQLLLNAADRFELVTGKTGYLLDFEYKKIAPEGKLIVKQIRQVPKPSQEQNITPMLINEPTCFCLFQGEGQDVFAYHRLKSRWNLETRSLWLTEDNLRQSILSNIQLEYKDRARIRDLQGDPTVWPYAYHKSEMNASKEAALHDGWRMHHLSNPRQYELSIEGLLTLVSPADSPVITLKDFAPYSYRSPRLNVQVEYDNPVEKYDWQLPPGQLGTTTTNWITLWPCLTPQEGDLLQERMITDEKTGTIQTSFYWPPPPTGAIAGYTAPLVRWVKTIITGLTSEPIELHGWYSQTYLPGHHNFFESFLFEPWFEPDLSPSLIEELRAKDIRLIHVYGPVGQDGIINGQIFTYGFKEETFQPGDIDGDKDTDSHDLIELSHRWLNTSCHECDGADLDGDGQVSLKDLTEIARAYLSQLP
ncbi:MAG: hypothetical protein JXA82_04365 [Sedimentisphaerales bacterium]|nr:hypothetical protein [Sedimentisphaerales bacterium]